MSRPTLWFSYLLFAFLTTPLVQAGSLSTLRSPPNTLVAASRGLTATANITRPVLVGRGSSTAEPSVADGGLFLTVQISSTLVSSTTTSASLTVSAVCEDDQIDPLEVKPIQVNVPLPGARTSAGSLTMDVELPWDGGRTELTDGDYYDDRSYDCTASVKLTATSTRRTKTTTASANPISWNVQVFEQAATIPTSTPPIGQDVNSANFRTASLDGTVETVPVAVGIQPDTLVTVDGQTLPEGSAVNISLNQPEGVDIPPGKTTPLFVAPVVKLGPEGTTFDMPVTLGFMPSGPLADTLNPIPLTYSETDQDWIDCRTAEDPCTPIDCPAAPGFEDGMVCIEVHHFSLWTLSSDKQIALQLELMEGSAAAPSWICDSGGVCPSSPTLQFGAKVFTRAAESSESNWTARMQVCVNGDEEFACGGSKDRALSGLTGIDVGCFPGTDCIAAGFSTGESPSGIYPLSLVNLDIPSWNSLQASVSARDVYLAVGYHDQMLPLTVTASSTRTHCPGNPTINESETLFDCLNLGITPRLDLATFDPALGTLTGTTTGFSSNANLKAGTLSLYWANANQCENTWNPVTAGAAKLTAAAVTANQVTASATSQLAENVRAMLSHATYGTVLGPCVPVTMFSPDVDKDGYTVDQGDCDDASAAIHPYSIEIAWDNTDNNCDGRVDEAPVIAAGEYHSVVVDSFGKVWVAGGDAYGQLGNGTTTNSSVPVPVQVPGLSGIVAVSAGFFSSLALDKQGRLWSWGEIPAQVTGLTGIVAIAAGHYHFMALDNQGRVWTWGDNDSGQLGNGTLTDSSTPVQVQGLSGIVAVAGGTRHSLAVDSRGRVWAWGENGQGQLGNGTTTDSSIPLLVSGLTEIVAVAGGAIHSVALDSEGRVQTWGGNASGQLGNGTTASASTPSNVVGLTGVFVVGISAGYKDTLVYGDDGNAWAWGDNGWGQLGDGTWTSSSIPLQVENLSGIESVAAGSNHSLALDSQGQVWAWGHNGASQFGDGTSMKSLIPAPVVELTGMESVALGNYHSLSRDNQGRVWAWGYNSYGQLGNGTKTNSGIPVQVTAVSGSIAVAAGNYYSLSLDTQGRVWAWGYNYYGQLGNGTKTASTVPVLATGLNGIVAFTAGWLHNLALDNQGRVWAWGYNSCGQLGNGTTTSSSTAVQVTGLSGVVAVAAGGSHSLALDSQGRVWAWGCNGSGQIGNGTTTNSSTPIVVTGLSGIVAIAGGGEHSFALDNQGRVWAWGYNYYGQLGSGTTADSSTPKLVQGLSGVVAIAAGWRHSLALDSLGRVWAWGNNSWGQLGNGTTADSSLPVLTTNLTGLTEIVRGKGQGLIDGGEAFSLAVRSNRTGAGWGDDAYLQLGSGNADALPNISLFGY